MIVTAATSVIINMAAFNYYKEFSLKTQSASSNMTLNLFNSYFCPIFWTHFRRKRKGGVEDTRLEAKAKDTKKIRGQGQRQPFRGQNLSRPRTRMLEAKDKNTSASVLLKKGLQNFFQAISNLLAYLEFLIGRGLNCKSHEMTSSRLFQTGSFCGTKMS